MKKRVSIYIDGDAWENLKERAWRARKSASGYLEYLIMGDPPASKNIDSEGLTLNKIVSVKTKTKTANSVPLVSYSKDKQLGKRGGK